MEDIKVGDKYRGKMNGAIFEIIEVNKRDGTISYMVNGERHFYRLEAFKRCLLEKIE